MAETSHYLDASFLAALFTPGPYGDRADQFVAASAVSLIVSDYGAAEFTSLVWHRVAERDFPVTGARKALNRFNNWIMGAARSIEASDADIDLALRFLKRQDLGLRTSQAIHCAIAQRLGAALVTIDAEMASVARALGVAVTVA